MIGVKFHEIVSLKLMLSDAVYIKLSFNSSMTLNMTKVQLPLTERCLTVGGVLVMWILSPHRIWFWVWFSAESCVIPCSCFYLFFKLPTTLLVFTGVIWACVAVWLALLLGWPIRCPSGLAPANLCFMPQPNWGIHTPLFFCLEML